MKSLLLVGSFLFLSGCASMFSGTRYPVTISSSPDRANLVVRNKYGNAVYKGVTPFTSILDVNGAPYRVEASLPGHNPETITLDTDLNGITFVNLALILVPFGGLLLSGGGFVIDACTGAMWELPDSVMIPLSPTPSLTTTTDG